MSRSDFVSSLPIDGVCCLPFGPHFPVLEWVFGSDVTVERDCGLVIFAWKALSFGPIYSLLCKIDPVYN